MFLPPIQSIQPIASIFNPVRIEDTQSGAQLPFKSMFTDAVADLKATDNELKIAVENAATGNIDDLHTVNIASTKAGLSLDLVIQLRNKALEAYNEIMRMGV